MPPPKSILVVDDDPSIHALVAAFLSDMDWRVDAAPSGQAALDHLLKSAKAAFRGDKQPRNSRSTSSADGAVLREFLGSSYDVVLTDIEMPGIDGLTLLNRIRHANPAAKVLIMTAHASTSDIIQSLRGQATGYLRKPFTQDALLAVLTNALEANIGPDDIEVLSDKPNWISLRVRCKLETADRLTQFIRELPAELDPPDRDAVATAFRELLMNAIEHGGRFNPDQKVDLSYLRLARSIVYYFRDPGEGFSPDTVPHAAIANTPEDPFAHVGKRRELGMRPGGFGLLLTRNFADELLYSAKGNEVILVKYLDARRSDDVW